MFKQHCFPTLVALLLFQLATQPRPCLAQLTTVSAPVPLSFAPDQNWEGIDGSWNTFTLGVGTPKQYSRVLVSTASQQTWVVAPQGCTAASDPNACESLRGGSPTLFNINQSSTWESIGIYGFPIEKNHGYSGDAQYGYESITLGLPGENGLMLNNMTVGAFAVLEPWLGMFGINPRNTNFSSFNDGSPSFITILRKNNLIPSLSFGYTAGAPYRLRTVLGSLTLGGYDQSRFQPNDLSFVFAPNNNRELLVGVQSITTNTTSAQLLPTGIYSDIDSTIAEMWLPIDACRQFEQAFGLAYDNASELYLINDTLHDSLVSINPNITFRLGIGISGGMAVYVSFPYASFDLIAFPPYQNLTNSTRYFPLRRAQYSDQYTLGRTFLQEAYLSVDWERAQFNVSQCIWPDNFQKDIVTIPSIDTTSQHPPSSASSSTLSGGATAGIVIGTLGAVAILLAIFFFFFLRRRRHRLAESKRQQDLVDEKALSQSTSLVPSTSPVASTCLVIPRAELSAAEPCWVGRVEADSDGGSNLPSPGIQSHTLHNSPTLRNSPNGSQRLQLGNGSTLSEPAEVDVNQRLIFEMPGDAPEISEMPTAEELNDKDLAIGRAMLYNGVSPPNITSR